jgi:chromosome transmission fidelity protein 1
LGLGDDDEPEWMIEFAKRDSRRTIAEKRQQFESRLAKIKQDEERLKQAHDSQERPRKKQVRVTLLFVIVIVYPRMQCKWKPGPTNY